MGEELTFENVLKCAGGTYVMLSLSSPMRLSTELSLLILGSGCQFVRVLIARNGRDTPRIAIRPIEKQVNAHKLTRTGASNVHACGGRGALLRAGVAPGRHYMEWSEEHGLWLEVKQDG